MKTNQNTRITGNHVVLVPYRDIHVPRYHEWMASPDLQKLTASEPLTLEEEYQMQKSWAIDEDKCTFIVLDKATLIETGSETDSMIGDTNLFFTDVDDPTLAEIEIMIAESSFRCKGRGREATIIMLQYGIQQLGIKHFQAKIGLENTVSIQMFQKMGFQETSRSQVFNEVTLTVEAGNEYFSNYVRDHLGEYTISTL